MINSFLPFRYHQMSKIVNPKYDSIVDRTDFKRGQDKERAMRLTGDTGGSPTTGVYDYPDGNISEDKTPTPLIMALRGGRLDKADVDTIQRVQQKAAKDEQQDAFDKKSRADKQAIDDARQSFIDSKTGFDSSSVKSQ